MFDRNKMDHVIQVSQDKTMNLFLRNNSELNYRLRTDVGPWSESRFIVRNVLSCSRACYSPQHGVLLACQDIQGNISLLQYQKDQWSSKLLLKDTSGLKRNKHLEVLLAQHRLHLFYILLHSGKAHLIFQTYDLETGHLEEPLSVDTLNMGRIPFVVSMDSLGQSYAFYRQLHPRFSRIGYKKFIPARNRWEEFTPVTAFYGESEILSASFDGENNLYILWQRLFQSKSQLVFYNNRLIKNTSAEDQILLDSEAPVTDASLLLLKNRLLVYWLDGKHIHHTASGNQGESWSSPVEYTGLDDGPVYCISFQSYDSQSQRVIPGSYVQGLTLAFLDDTAKEETAETVPDRSLENGQLLRLSKKMEEVLHTIGELTGRITALEARELKVEPREPQKEAQSESPEETRQDSQNANPKQPRRSSPDVHPSEPLMPGAGFSYITPEFLRNLGRKE